MGREETADERRCDGVVLLDKAVWVSSFVALSRLKRELGTRRVGHAGTLDPFATGLLVALCGSATRLARLLHGLEKTYLATVRMGSETDTLDTEGTVVATAPVPELAAIEAALPAFRGSIMQVPPAFSALNVGGRRAYMAARAGEEITIPPREVRISELSLIEYRHPDLRIRIRCSGGTYVRSLARDLGKAAGSRAYLVELRRTAIGSIDVADAVPSEEFRAGDGLLEAGAFLSRYSVIPILSVDEEEARRMRLGQARPAPEGCRGRLSATEVACLDPSGRLAALAELKGPLLRVVSGFVDGR